MNTWVTKSIYLVLAIIILLTALTAIYISFRLPIVGSSIAELEDALDVKEYGAATEWDQMDNLNIFNHRADGAVIAPSSSGSYRFTIENSARFPFEYTLQISDINDIQIPMQFRLHDSNGAYVYGSDTTWVSIEDMHNVRGALDYQTDTEYTLDWRWPEISDTVDTAYGVLAVDGAFYTLNFLINARQSGPIASPWANHYTLSLIFPLILALILSAFVFAIAILIYIPKKGHEEAAVFSG